MIVCGYNEQMGRGLKLLFEGVHATILERSRRDELPFSEVLRREIIEMTRISGALKAGQGCTLSMLVGLNAMVTALFEDLLSSGDPDLADEAVFMKEVDKMVIAVMESDQYNALHRPPSKSSDTIIERSAGAVGEWMMKEYASAPK